MAGLAFVLFQFWGNAYAGLDARQATRSLFVWLAQRWNDSSLSFGGNYSHGWLVPAISGWLVWRRRDALRAACGTPYWPALGLTAAALAVHWMGLRGEVPQLSALSLILLLWAVPSFLWGRAVEKLLFFPAVYLLFALPLSLLDSLTFPLRMLATVTASGLLNGLGVEVTRVGTALHSAVGGGFHLEVADPCSGIRSLTAMMAVAAGYAYVTHSDNRRRWLLFLSAIPLAVLGNLARLLTVGLVAAAFGMGAAMHVYHDYSGYLTYAVALGAFLTIDRLLRRGMRPPPPETAPRTDIRPPESPAAPAHYLAVLSLLAATLAVVSADTKPPADTRLPLQPALPSQAGEWEGTDTLFCQNPDCLRSFAVSALDETHRCPQCGGALDAVSYPEHQLLPADTRLTRKIYQRPGGPPVTVAIVFSGRERSSIHRPEICLPSQGFTIASRAEERVSLPGRSPLGVTVLRLQAPAVGKARAREALFGYWFSGGPQRETPSHLRRIAWTALDRVLRHTAPRWAYVSITVSGNSGPSAVREMTRLIAALYPLLQTDAPGDQ